jgi:hypothetical protein
VSQNPYAPPTSEVADPAQVAHATPIFYAVSPLKLLILSFGTLGLYQYYWIYKNWQLHKQRTGKDISPLPRAFFAILFVYQLFKNIDQQTAEHNTRRISAGPLAMLWIVATLLWKLPDPYWLVTYLSILVLVPVQWAVNDLNAVASPGHDANTRFTAWNWVAVLLGLPFFALAIIGTLSPAA